MVIKIIEGTITTKEIEVLTADENRAIAKSRFAEIQKEQEEKERKRLQDLQNRCVSIFPEVIANILADVNRSAKAGHTWTFEVCWSTDSNQKCYGMNWEEFCFMEKDIEAFLNNLGYRLIHHHYSQSWITRSGKLGYMWVSWTSTN
jgi:hypothetical protein